ncbi:NAD-glutamate dehydrogenase domain-containing protein, partial [Streptomyces sp. NPDC005389]|uniref:NAD-glutamate dehydrogenase domain-containing protein n=1 Tax=Streptomyces sp. NPDC005389 TaxID=3157040 RepID=UPI0033AAD937
APRPAFEIWVYSPRVEGVHLRPKGGADGSSTTGPRAGASPPAGHPAPAGVRWRG